MIKLPKSNSTNSKLGKGVRATYRAVGPTCPQSCEALKSNVCYALYGYVNMHAKRSEYDRSDADRVYQYLVDLPRGQKIRHHVSGDFMKPGDKVDRKYVTAVVRGHIERPDLQGWSYTHAWERLPAKKLNSADSLTVNSSCDNIGDVIKSLKKGWPATLVVGEDTQSQTLNLDGKRVKLVICPHQTHQVLCSDCMLCFRKQRSCVVGFRVHGTGKSKFHDERGDNTSTPLTTTPMEENR